MYTHSFQQLLRHSLSFLLLLAGMALSGCDKEETEIPTSKPGEDGIPVLAQAVNSSIPMLDASGSLPPGEWTFYLKTTRKSGISPAKEFLIPGTAGEKQDGTYMHLLLPENTPCIQYIVSYVMNEEDETCFDLGFLIEVHEDGSIGCSTNYNKDLKLFGAGTDKDPYQISSLSDIVSISAANTKKDLAGVYFVQIDDINCNDEMDFNSDHGGIKPIGDSNRPFKGHYRGYGNYISGLSIISSGEGDASNNVGLFGVIDGDATVSNLTMIAPNIQDGRNNIGSIAGCMSGNSQITNCTVVGGSLYGIGNVGGIVGYMQGGKLRVCQNKECSIMAQTENSPYTDCMGGIVGKIVPQSGAPIEMDSLTSNTNIIGHENVGGIIGFLGGNGSTLYKMSELTSTRTSDNIKSISGVRSVGGLIGGCSASLELTNSAAIPLIKATTGDLRDFGGLIGAIGTTGSVKLKDCITGANQWGEQPDASKKYISGSMLNLGGIIGYVRADGGVTLSNCIVASNIQGKQYIGGLIGKTISPTTIENCTNNKGTIIATQTSDAYAGGLVGCAMDNITFSGENLNEGNVDTQGNYAGGFIAYVNEKVTLKGGLVTANVSASGRYGGGYVGYAKHLTAESINTGASIITISASEYQGGLAGYAGQGTIQQVTLGFKVGNEGSTSASSGGIIGFLYSGTINSCTFTGSVQGGQYTGGIAGRQNGGNINNCKTNSNNKILNNDNGEVGGIIGGMTQVGILNCENRTKVENKNKKPFTGGIVGYIDAQSDSKQIRDCHNYASVSGGDQTGGILGGTCSNSSNNTQIAYCHNHKNATITGQDETGGISGSFAQGQMIFCSNHGDVTATKSSAGGIAGCLYGSKGFHASGLVDQSYNLGTIDAPQNVGGLVGKFFNWSYARIHNSYNRAQVGHDGSSSCAGIVGHIDNNAYGEINNSYSGGTARTGWGIFGRIYSEVPTECSWNRCHYSEESAPSDGHNTSSYTRNTNGGLSDKNNFHDWDFSGVWEMKVQPELRNNRETTE